MLLLMLLLLMLLVSPSLPLVSLLMPPLSR
jgi:hypothetical protein